MAREQLTLLTVTDDNLTMTLEALAQRQLVPRFFWDRAFDADQKYTLLHEYFHNRAVYWINSAERARWAWNKATMHLELISVGLHTPYTILLDPYDLRPDLNPPDLTVLGKEFIVKPAHGGGGEGVVQGANGWEAVQAARKMHPRDFYLLQERIEPVWFASRPAWFRVIMVFDQCYLCWWNPWTHSYTTLTDSDRDLVDTQLIIAMMQTIKNICRLDIFSSEIAFTSTQKYVVVDYINDPIDLRSQVQTPDGVPDEILADIIRTIIEHIK